MLQLSGFSVSTQSSSHAVGVALGLTTFRRIASSIGVGDVAIVEVHRRGAVLSPRNNMDCAIESQI